MRNLNLIGYFVTIRFSLCDLCGNFLISTAEIAEKNSKKSVTVHQPQFFLCILPILPLAILPILLLASRQKTGWAGSQAAG